MFGGVDFPEEQVRRARAGYYGLITYLDEKIGRLLAALEETGQRDNTLIVHFSDHGEMNGEHGMWRKSSMYEASAKVPLQMVYPGQIPAGRRVDEVVSLVDLVATIVEVADAPSAGSIGRRQSAGIAARAGRGPGRTKHFPNTSPTACSGQLPCCGAAATSSTTAWEIHPSYTT